MNRLFWSLTALLVCGIWVVGCSKEPPVEKEVLEPPKTTELPAGHPAVPDAGMVGSSHQQEADVSQEKMAAPAEPPTIQAKPGFRAVRVPSASGDMQFLLPENWQATQPTSMMRAYQASIPPVEGDTQAAEVAFFTPIGGSIQDNINRWMGQFTQPDGSPSSSKATTEDIQGEGHAFKLVALTGTMLPSSMPGMPQQGEKTGWMMLGSIIETPGGVWYIKATGPEKTLGQARDGFVELCKSLRINEGNGPAGSTTGQ